MTKFKAGDKFIPRKPKEQDYPLMGKYWDKIFTVKSIENGWIRSVESGSRFRPDWCEKADNNYSEITSNIEQIPDIEKTIDWEQRRYEIAKEFMAAHIAGCISGGVQWFYKTSAAEVIVCADELIKQLQKTSENNRLK